MRKHYNLLFILSIPALFLLFTSEVLYHTGSPGGKTGSPGDNGNNCTDCHSGTPVTEDFWIYSPELLTTNYVPGQTYSMFVIGVDADANKIGFEATAEDASGNKVGTFMAGGMGFTQTLNGGTSITHTALGSTPIADTGTIFVFNWTAPPTNVGEITFYAAVNTANGNGSTSGDQIHLSQFVPGSINVGISENKEDDLKIFPNPSEGIVNISKNSVSESDLTVLNVNGQVVFKEKTNGKQTKIDLSFLKKGVYFIQIDQSTRRIILR
ncbi:MAG: T9SS type A sorting domain-containing protein [Bacteroidetes bacterium]|nr:T9SS type A sorting domain-containing protein [Bacteroidota bacterium]